MSGPALSYLAKMRYLLTEIVAIDPAAPNARVKLKELQERAGRLIIEEAESINKSDNNTMEVARKAAIESRKRAMEQRDAELLPIILRLKSENYSQREIADALNAMNIFPPSAKLWRQSTVNLILRRNGHGSK